MTQTELLMQEYQQETGLTDEQVDIFDFELWLLNREINEMFE